MTDYPAETRRQLERLSSLAGQHNAAEAVKLADEIAAVNQKALEAAEAHAATVAKQAAAVQAAEKERDEARAALKTAQDAVAELTTDLEALRVQHDELLASVDAHLDAEGVPEDVTPDEPVEAVEPPAQPEGEQF